MTMAILILGLTVVDAEPVDVELVLAADGSGSIDDDEFRTQREGYAGAVTHHQVLDAIGSGALGRIALAYVEWGGPASQHTIVPWTVIDGPASAGHFADALLAAPRRARGYNSISAVIDYAARLIETNGHGGLAKVIDVSGDGPNIGGRPVALARDDAVRADITVNALVVQRPGGGYRGPSGEPLVEHYRNDVIGGPGSFVATVVSGEQFADAVRRKLIREIAGTPTPDSDLPHAGGGPSNQSISARFGCAAFTDYSASNRLLAGRRAVHDLGGRTSCPYAAQPY